MLNSDEPSISLQENIVTLIIFSDASSNIIRSSIEVSLFTSRAYREIVTRAYSFLDTYKEAPKDHMYDLLEDLVDQDNEHSNQIKEALWKARDLWPRINEAYVLEQVDRFVLQQSVKTGIVVAYELVQRKDIEGAVAEILKAVKRRDTTFTPGLTLKQVIKELSNPNEQRDTLSLGIGPLDNYGLGPARKELHLLIAPPKKGKSQWLVHCTKRALMQRWKVVYITLELADKFVGRRALQALFALKTRDNAEVKVSKFLFGEDQKFEGLETRIRNISSIENPENIPPLAHRVEAQHMAERLFIKQFPTGSLSVQALHAYLDQLDNREHFVPDMVVVDYADLMKIDAKNYRLDLGGIYKDLRGLAVERNLLLLTASQSTRGGSKAKLVQGSDVAEDYSKIGTADCVLTYSQTDSEKRRGLARLYVAAGRVEADRFSILISQSYTSGQFALESWYIGQEYWTFFKGDQKEGENEEEE